jgi:hypothetical protein
MTLHIANQQPTWFTYDNFGANPAATFGTSITAGAANAEGSWGSVATGTNLSRDIEGLYIQIHSCSAATNVRPLSVDVGVDPAGGTTYTEKISNLNGGFSGVPGGTGIAAYYFPLSIKRGSQVAVRGSTNFTGITARVACKFYGAQPELMRPKGMYCETLGAGATGVYGTVFTPGNAADGSWVSLGTTTRDHWWWQLGYNVYNTVITAEHTYIDLAYGDANNKRIIKRLVHFATTSEVVGAVMANHLLWEECYFPVPRGTEIFVRGRCANAPDTGYRAIAYGMGG